MNKNNIIRIVGGDVGFGTSVGAVLEFNTITKKAQWIGEQVLASRAKQGVNLREDMFNPLNNNYSVNDLQFTVDPSLDGEGVDNRQDYHFSAIQCVLMQHLLQNLQLSADEDLHIVSGMPISLYYNNNQRNETAIARKIDVLKNTEVVPLYNARPITLKNIQMMSEGVGAYLNLILTDQGDLISGAEDETVGIIDIGDGTTDITVISNLTVIDHSRTASAEIGVSDMTREIRLILEKEHGINGESDYRIKRMIHLRTYRANGHEYSIDEINAILLKAMTNVYFKLDAFIRRVFTKSVDLDRILIVGGGAAIFGDKIKEVYPQSMVIDKPQLANAYGFAKYGLHQLKG